MSTKKRRADDMALEAPKFPDAQDIPWGGEFVFRDNSEELGKLGKQDLILRPTQMGKTSLFSLANVLYNRRFKNRERPAVNFRPFDANSRFVLLISFLNVSGQTAADVDHAVGTTVARTVSKFLTQNPDLANFYQEPADGRPAGAYLEAVAAAVARFGQAAREEQSFLVLVDEYDKPARELLIDLVGTGDTAAWVSVKRDMQNYRNFFSCCKVITESTFLEDTDGLGHVNVWVTGVLPLALNIISDFTPKSYTFDPLFAEAIGLLDSDVDRMLEDVNNYLPFDNKDQMSQVRNAIRKLANRLAFGSHVPLYHTRVVNTIMKTLVDHRSRGMWLDDLSKLPQGIHYQVIPQSVFDVVRQHGQVEIRHAIKDLSLNKEIPSVVNEELNLGDVLENPMSLENYLTLLVHLGVASMRKRHGQTVFHATSIYFRVPFFRRILENSLQPLLDASSLHDIYSIGETQVAEFMQSLPKSGMSSLIRCAKQKRDNNILELQFQEFLIAQLADSLWHEEVEATQEDRLEVGRTDVTIAGKSSLIVLELKQKATKRSPSESEMKNHHNQLHRYMHELIQRESSKPKPKLVAGFVVVMYNDCQSFHVERTTYA